MRVRIIIASIILGLTGLSFASGQVKSRVAGLEGNKEYMELLQSEHGLKIAEDSLVKRVTEVRVLLQNEPDNRSKHGMEILRLENEIFDLRSKSGLLSVKINQIEQDFVVNNLDKHIDKPNGNAIATVDSTSVKNLVYNDYFKKNLAADDLSKLLASQEKEQAVMNYLRIYNSTYKMIQKAGEIYEKESKAARADTIYSKYLELTARNNSIADSIDAIWDFIYDNKSYSYSYLFDKMNRNDVLLWFEEQGSRVRQQQVEMKEKYPSPAVMRYDLEKKLILEYEMQLAQTLNMQRPVDSLVFAKKMVDSLDLKHPPIKIAERSFVEYAPVKFVARSPYTSAKPIPKRTVYNRGTVYSVLVGSFARAQAPTIFRNATPLFVEHKDGKFNYYAGVLSSEKEAQEAQSELKQKGFRSPEVVVWENNEFRNITQESRRDDSIEALYRIEIRTDKSDLPSEVKEVVMKAQGVDIARTISNAGDENGNGREYLFIVSSFNSRDAAKRIYDAIAQINEELRLSIEEIKE